MLNKAGTGFAVMLVHKDSVWQLDKICILQVGRAEGAGGFFWGALDSTRCVHPQLFQPQSCIRRGSSLSHASGCRGHRVPGGSERKGGRREPAAKPWGSG